MSRASAEQNRRPKGRTDAGRALAALAQLSEAVAGRGSAVEVLERALDPLLDYLDITAAAMLLTDPLADELRPVAGRALTPAAVTYMCKAVKSAMPRLDARHEALWLLGDDDPDWSSLCDEMGRVAAVPVHANGQVSAVLLIVSSNTDLLDSDSRIFLDAIALQIGAAIEHSRLLLERDQRSVELAALHNANRALTTSLDPLEAMRTIIDASMQLTHSHSGAIALVDGSSETLEYVAYIGMPAESTLQPGTRLAFRSTLAGRCAVSGEPLILNDLSTLAAYDHGIRQSMPGLYSLLCMPLIAHGQVIGVLALAHQARDYYRQEHVDLLCGPSSQAAGAIENARLFRDSQEHLARLTATYRMAQALSSTVELQSVIETVVADATKQTSFPIAALALMQPRTLTVDFPASVGMPERFRRLIDGIPINSPYLEGSAFQIAMNSHRPAIVEDVATDPSTEPVREIMLRAGLVSYVCMPLVAKGRFEGALFVYDRHPRPDAAIDLPYLTALADQAAVAIANARLYESMDESLHQTRALQRVTSALAASLDLQELLGLALTSAVQLFGADRAAIYMFDHQAQEVTCAASHGLSDEYLLAVQAAYRNDRGARPQQPDYRYLADAQTEQRTQATRDAARREGFHSILLASLKFREERVGTFALYHNNVRHYSETEIGLAKTLAEQAGIAIEHAHLFAQTQRLAVVEERNRLARELHDSVTQSLFSMSLIAQALPALMQRSPTGAQERIERLGDLARGALAEMRSLIFELRPAALEEEGLAEAIRKHAASFQSHEAIDVVTEIAGRERRLPIEIEEALFRITQETLNNVSKHARASSVTITLQFSDNQLALSVRDDGVGFLIDEPNGRHGGFGMTSMRQRAERLGGSFGVRSMPGGGTSVQVEIPAPPPAAGA